MVNPHHKHSFSLLELLIALFLFMIVSSAFILQISSASAKEQIKTTAHQIQALFDMANRQALLTDNAVSVIIRKAPQKGFIGYIVLSKNIREKNTPLFKETTLFLPHIAKIHKNNECTEQIHVIFCGRKGPFGVTSHGYVQKLSMSEPIHIELIDDAGTTNSIHIPLASYGIHPNGFKSFPDDLYHS